MPIVVSHQPDPALLASAGYVAGLGEYQQRQREMEQRERMQIRGLQANLMSQAYSTQAGFARQQMGFQHDAAINDLQAKRQKEMFDLQRQDRFDMFKMEMEQRQQDQMLQNSSMLERDMARFYLDQVNQDRGRIQEMLADGYEFSPVGAAEWEATNQQLSKIQSDYTLTPRAKAEAMYKLMSSKNLVPQLKQPTFAERFQQNTEWIDDPNNPGRKILVGNVRDFQVLAEGEPQEQQPPQMTFRQFMGSGTDESRKERARLEKMAMDLLTEEVPVAGDLTGKTTTKKPTLQDINKWIERYIDHQDGTTFPEPMYDQQVTQQLMQQMQAMRKHTAGTTVKTWSMKDGVK